MSWTSIEQTLALEDCDGLMVMSFEFHDSLAATLISPGNHRRERSRLFQLSPVFFVDSKATSDQQFSRLPQFIEVHPTHRRGGAHHPKVYCTLSRGTVRLLVGSMNLTENGIRFNRETFRNFLWNHNNQENLHILDAFIAWVRTHYIKEKEGYSRAIEFIERVETARNELQEASDKKETHWLSSGYETSGLDQLESLWRSEHGEKPADTLLVVTPYFDFHGDGCLAQSFLERGIISAKTQMMIFTAPNRQQKWPFSKNHFSVLQKAFSNLEVFCPEQQLGKESAEWGFLRQELEGRTGVRLKAEDTPIRSLHSKLLVLLRGDQGLIYTGSANFTQAAWSGTNQELGIVDNIKGQSATQLRNTLIKGLSAEKVDISTRGFPDSPEPHEDETPFVPLYPDFIEAVILENLPEGFQFRFEVDDLNTARVRIQSYKISWGNSILSFNQTEDQLVSNVIPLENAHLIRQRRTLLFAIKDAEFFIPYSYSSALDEARIEFQVSDIDSWLSQFLMASEAASGFEGIEEAEWDSDDRPPVPELSEIQREQNKTIRMQRFVSAIDALETGFRAQVTFAEGRTQDGEKVSLFQKNSPQNMEVFFNFAISELMKRDGNCALSLFQTGEGLLVLRRALEEVRSPEIRQEIETLIENVKLRLNDIPTPKGSVFEQYRSLIMKKCAAKRGEAE